MNNLQTTRLPRVDIAQFIPEPRGVRAFEALQQDITNQYSALTTASFLTVTSEPSLGAERVLTLTGDLSGTDGGANAAYTLGLSATTVVAGAYGGAGSLVSFTVDAKGRLTAASTVAGADLTKTDDTNVTLTLGGTPTGSLLKATSLTLGWTGQLSVPRGGTGAATLTGYVKGNGAAALTASATVPVGDVSGGQALTKVDDTNVTATLGGTPGSALLTPASITLGWTGTLAVARGGTGGGVASGTLLDNISGFASTGHLVRTGAGTYAFRTVTGTSNQIDVANGSGVGGNPTISISATYAGQSSIVTIGTITNALLSSSATGGTGYATGAGGTVTQLTSKSTAVTLNKVCGQITTNNAALAAGTEVGFTVNNSAYASTDVVLVQPGNGNYDARVTDGAAGSFVIRLKNMTGGSLSDAVVINFAIIKAVAA